MTPYESHGGRVLEIDVILLETLMYFEGQQWTFRVSRGFQNTSEKQGGANNVGTGTWDFKTASCDL